MATDTETGSPDNSVIRGWVIYGHHFGYICEVASQHYGGSSRLYDIGEAFHIGVILPDMSRQVHSIKWHTELAENLTQRHLKNDRRNYTVRGTESGLALGPLLEDGLSREILTAGGEIEAKSTPPVKRATTAQGRPKILLRPRTPENPPSAPPAPVATQGRPKILLRRPGTQPPPEPPKKLGLLDRIKRRAPSE